MRQFLNLLSTVREDPKLNDEPQAQVQDEPDLAEGYPTTTEVLRKCLQSDRIPDSGIRRLEVNCFADGSATIRVHLVGQDDTEGDFLPGPDSS